MFKIINQQGSNNVQPNQTYSFTPPPPKTFGQDVKLTDINKNMSAQTANSFTGMTHPEHIYKLSDTYIGSDEQIVYKDRVFDFNQMKMVDKKISIPEGFERIFLEILSNASDHVERSRRSGVDPGEINITMDQYWIVVKNSGAAFPVNIHKSGVWTPDFVFGALLTSSNYQEKTKAVRTVCGRNGYGAKLTNIYSKRFIVNIGDSGGTEDNGNIRYPQKYYQEWSNNFANKTDPIIEPYNGPAYVEISYLIDFARFGYTCYIDDAFSLFARYVIDVSYACKVPVTFNGQRFHYVDPREYIKLYYDTVPEHYIMHYEWPANSDVQKKKGGYQVSKKGDKPYVEMIIVDDPRKGRCESFVNGIYTKEGGVHVNEGYQAVGASVLNALNTDKKGNKNTVKLNVGHVKKHLTIFMNCWVDEPKFDRQAKSKFTGPKIPIAISDSTLRAISKWDFTAGLYADLQAMQINRSKKSDRNNRRGKKKLEWKDANKAKEKGQTVNCVAWLAEGNSAMSYPLKGRDLYPNGNDYIGICPLGGKPLNALKASFMRVVENRIFSDLRTFLGLQEGMDYSIDKNYETLRYGHVVLMCDSDVDGKHITGLVINWFNQQFKALLQRGYLMFLRTPIVRVKHQGRTYKFFSLPEYQRFQAEHPDFKQTDSNYNYYKGLGTSEDPEIADDFKQPRVVSLIYDDTAPQYIRMAFDDKLSDLRKKWIAEWKPYLGIEEFDAIPISQFINHELAEFSAYNVYRAIPGMDGLKPSQRKCIYAAQIRWGKTFGGKKKDKVSQFANFTSAETDYQHGEDSLNKTIIGMAQDFCGSNNIPYFYRHGQFGTREMMGKDAASPRYIHVTAEPILKYIFREDDIPIYVHHEDGNDKMEPYDMYPILPVHMINGACGIGTGHSTFIPCHHPLDLVNWIKTRLNMEVTPYLLPWYSKFTGKIQVEISKKGEKKKIERPQSEGPTSMFNIVSNSSDESVDHNIGIGGLNTEVFTEGDEEDDEYDADPLGPDELFDAKKSKMKMVSLGKYEDQGNKVVVSELPLGVSTMSYINFLETLVDKGTIKSFDNKGTVSSPCFWIYGMSNPKTKKLRLRKTYGLSNMVVLNEDNRPIHYSSSEELMEYWFQHRWKIYSLRKQNLIDKATDKIKDADLRMRFILSVINKELRVINRPRSEILPNMQRLGYPDWLLKKVKTYEYIQDEVDKLRALIAKLQEELNRLINTTESEFWIKDLTEFENYYIKHYGYGSSDAIFVQAKPKKKKTNQSSDNQKPNPSPVRQSMFNITNSNSTLPQFNIVN